MIGFLKRLFGSAASKAPPEPTRAAHSPGPANQQASDPSPRSGGGRVSDHYFELSALIERGNSQRDYRSAIAAARETYTILPEFVRNWKGQYGRFDIQRSHAVHTAPTLMAVLEDRESIRELRVTLEGIKELHQWLSAAEEAERDVELVIAILRAVRSQPGVEQSRLKDILEAEDGHRISQLASWLEKAGRIRRVRKGRTHLLYPADQPGVSPTVGEGGAVPAGTAPAPGSAEAGPVMALSPPLALTLRSRPHRSAMRARAIALERLPYVRLPRAPATWEERQRQEHEGTLDPGRSPQVRPRFVVEGDGWQIVSEAKLAKAERPDPAYRRVFPTSGSTFWLDPTGRREGFEGAPSVLRVTDRSGALVAERGLAQDVYRADVNTDGSAVLFMSRDGLLHAYSDRLEQIFAERVADIPEYRAQAHRLGILPHELHTHTRCVAVSADRSRYVMTVVDEAWCLSATTGEVLWGLRFPAQAGWSKVAAARSERIGTSGEVDAALRLMELHLPVGPEDIKRQYRQLALRWHPDRNPGDNTATARFQELTAAMEILTGADMSGVTEREAESVTYQKILSRERVGVPGAGGGSGVEVTFSMHTSEKGAADWIYAANFAARDNRVFLASYSGRIVEVTDDGMPARAYDLAAVPRHVGETESHLYLLTDTRLYVLSGDRLEALVDVFDQGSLIVGETGFGLLESKEFSWFRATGRRLGGVRTKDPIRRVLSGPEGLVIETRQHRVVAAGAPSWWRG